MKNIENIYNIQKIHAAITILIVPITSFWHAILIK